MHHAHKWIVDGFENSESSLYSSRSTDVSSTFDKIVELESIFLDAVGGKLTKRQAVILGLVARTYQLAVSCFTCVLFQNYAGWNCAFRGLMETFFTIDWLNQEPQRFEAFFEGTAPGIGRIKADSCSRNEEMAEAYSDASKIVHVKDRALHLPRAESTSADRHLPFCATDMNVSKATLEEMTNRTIKLLGQTDEILRVAAVDNYALSARGSLLWNEGCSKCNFGCLGFEPRENESSSESES